ncbi:MAG: MFS transporter [Candidatus Bathyarchaeia archaeon]
MRRYKILALCSLVHGLNHSYWVILPPLLPILIKEFEISTTEAGLLASAFFIPYAIFQLPIGSIADRVDRRLLIGLGLLLSAVGIFLSGLAPNYWTLLIFQAVAGFGGGTYHPSAIAVIAQNFPSEERGRAYGLHGIATNLSFFITPLMVTHLATWGWRTPFLLFGLLGVVASAIFLPLAGRQANSATVEERKRMTFVLRNRQLLKLSSINASVTVVDRGVVTFLPLLLTVIYSFDVAQAGSTLSLFFLFGLAGQLIGGYLTDRIDRRVLLTAMLTAIGIGTLAFALAPSPLLALPTVAIVAIFLFSTFPLTETLATTFLPEASRGSGLGVYFTISSGVGAFSPYLIGGLIAILGYQPAYLSLAFVAFAGVLISARSGSKQLTSGKTFKYEGR